MVLVNQIKAENLNRSFVIDPWLTKMIGKEAYIAKESNDPISQSFIPEDAFIFCKIPTHNIEDLINLQCCGFRVIEIAIQFKRDVHNFSQLKPSTDEGVKVSFSTTTDQQAVEMIAGKSFTCSRFHLDPKVDKIVANRIKKEWAGNYFKGERGDGMIVARYEGAVVGFLQYLYRQGSLIIDLIAVAPPVARKGIGRKMIHFLIENGHQGTQGDTVIVGTQGCNIASCNLYESMGFKIQNTHFSLHLHT